MNSITAQMNDLKDKINEKDEMIERLLELLKNQKVNTEDGHKQQIKHRKHISHRL